MKAESWLGFGDAPSGLLFAAATASDRASSVAAFGHGFLAAALLAAASAVIAARLPRLRL